MLFAVTDWDYNVTCTTKTKIQISKFRYGGRMPNWKMHFGHHSNGLFDMHGILHEDVRSDHCWWL